MTTLLECSNIITLLYISNIMNLKSYKAWRLLVTIFLAMTISVSISMKNFFVPVVAVIIASLILLQLRKKVKEVLADERDMEIGGKAAMLAIRIFGWISIFPIFALYAFRDRNPSYEPIGMTLAFSVCILMLLYSAIFRFYHKMKFSDKRMIYTIFVLIGFFVFAVMSLRVFSGEDDWMCKDGKWVEHGHPSFPAPSEPCR